MKRNDKPAGVKVTPDTPAPRTEETPKAAKGQGRSDKGLGGPRTNPGQTPDTPSAAFRQGSGLSSAAPVRHSEDTQAAEWPPYLEPTQADRGGPARRTPPAPPATPAADPWGHRENQGSWDAIKAGFFGLSSLRMEVHPGASIGDLMNDASCLMETAIDAIESMTDAAVGLDVP